MLADDRGWCYDLVVQVQEEIVTLQVDNELTYPDIVRGG